MPRALFAVLLATGLVGAVAQSKIGRQTRDVLGTVQQLGELAVLLMMLLLWA